jgi:flagellar motor switch protein FliG
MGGEILKKVLGDCDNEELALAMLSCSPKVQQHLLGRLSPRRRALVEEQLATAKSAQKDQIVEARLKITRRFREALG